MTWPDDEFPLLMTGEYEQSIMYINRKLQLTQRCNYDECGVCGFG